VDEKRRNKKYQKIEAMTVKAWAAARGRALLLSLY